LFHIIWLWWWCYLNLCFLEIYFFNCICNFSVIEPNWSKIEFVVGLMQAEADEGDETWDVFNNGGDGDILVENWSSSSCSSVLTESAAVLSRFICFWKKVSVWFWTIFNLNVLSVCCFLQWSCAFCLYDHSNHNKTCYVFFI
jgi:hypothetical protein